MRGTGTRTPVLSLAVSLTAAVSALVLGAGEVHAAHLRPAVAAAAVTQTPPPVIGTPTLLPYSPAPTPAPAPTPTPKPAPSTDALAADLTALASAAGAGLGVSLVQLGAGAGPISFTYNGDQQFTAASTYKLPILMYEAQGIASGALKPDDQLCFQDSDYEDGWFDDYAEGACFSRQELAVRTGRFSDNTAAHILADEFGGSDGVNAYAAAHGAVNSQLMDPNFTTPNDLAALWADEAAGKAGGTAAQAWLYPILTNTEYESGIPAGVLAGSTVVHKVGFIDGVVNDAALVRGGPTGDYILVVMTDGEGGDAGYQLIAEVSARIARFEASR